MLALVLGAVLGVTRRLPQRLSLLLHRGSANQGRFRHRGASAGLARLVAAIFDGVPKHLALGIAMGGEERPPGDHRLPARPRGGRHGGMLS